MPTDDPPRTPPPGVPSGVPHPGAPPRATPPPDAAPRVAPPPAEPAARPEAGSFLAECGRILRASVIAWWEFIVVAAGIVILHGVRHVMVHFGLLHEFPFDSLIDAIADAQWRVVAKMVFSGYFALLFAEGVALVIELGFFVYGLFLRLAR
ncbi:hypothetical protein [Paraburkholderia unamae]|uniref:Uncharacterized protein n=1 Tax=Paraburkholderia unamae TaxID=219649 RepID=A0ACC6RYP3_9BURK